MSKRKTIQLTLACLGFSIILGLLLKAQVPNTEVLNKSEIQSFIQQRILYTISGDSIPEKYQHFNSDDLHFFSQLKTGVQLLENNHNKEAWQIWQNALHANQSGNYLAEAYFIIATSIGEQDGYTSFILLQKALEITRKTADKNRVLEYCCLNELVQMLVSQADDLSENQDTDKLAKKYSFEAHKLLNDKSFTFCEANASQSVYRIATESLFWLGQDSLAFEYLNHLLANKNTFENPDLVQAYADILKGVKLYIDGHYKQSEVIFKSAIKTIGTKSSFLDYNLELPYAYLGAVYIKQKRFAEAIDYMEKSAKTLANEFYSDINQPLQFIPTDELKKENSVYNIILCLLRLQHFYKEAINHKVEGVQVRHFQKISNYTNELIRAWFLNAADENILFRATKLMKLSNGNDVDLMWDHKTEFNDVEKRVYQLQTEASSFYLNYLIELRKQHNNNARYEKIRSLSIELMNAEKEQLHLQDEFISKRLKLLQLKSEIWQENQDEIKQIVFNHVYPEHIAEGEAVLKYFMSYTELYVSCITANGNVWKKLNADHLSQQIRKFKYAVKSKAIATEEQQYFYNVLIKPIEKELAGIHKLTLLSDERLDGITFELLQNEKEEFLINNFSIKYAYSSKNFNENGQASIERILAFAPGFVENNTFVSSNVTRDVVQDCDFISHENRSAALAPIPSSKDEVIEIGKLFGAYDLESQIFTSKDATKTQLLNHATEKSLIHIATHGISKGEYNSGLFFSLQDSDNGFLSLQELYGLSLNADLVVLSACKTGVGDVKAGEGIMALPRGFFCAGTKNIIASLWKVHDEKTKDLMVAFYKHLLEDKVSYAEALRLAKLDCIKKGFLPMDWAGFVLIGN